MPESKVVIYRPNNSLRHGYFSIISSIFHELQHNKWLTFQLFKRDLFAVYKQSFLGILWAFINPTITVAMAVIMSESGVLNINVINVPKPLFILLGTSVWSLFATSLAASTNSIVAAGPMVSKINFCKKSLVISSVSQSLVPFAVQLALLAGVFTYFHYTPSAYVILMPLLAFPMIMLSCGLGFILAIANAVVRDVGTALTVLLSFVYWLTPIAYNPHAGIVAKAAKVNILYYLVKVPRDLALYGHTDGWTGYIIATAIAFVIFWVCLVAFHLAESRIAERA